jgi:hypothetical protein
VDRTAPQVSHSRKKVKLFAINHLEIVWQPFHILKQGLVLVLFLLLLLLWYHLQNGWCYTVPVPVLVLVFLLLGYSTHHLHYAKRQAIVIFPEVNYELTLVMENVERENWRQSTSSPKIGIYLY